MKKIFIYLLFLLDVSCASYKYIAIGSSDGTPQKSYPYIIEDALNISLLNLGATHRTADQVLLYDVPTTLIRKPKIITIWIGMSDIIKGRSVGQFEADLDDILKLLSTLNTKIYIATIPNLDSIREFHYVPYITKNRIDIFNYNIKKLVTRYNQSQKIHIVDLSSLSNPIYFSEYYLNNAGHALVAQTFIDQMK